MKIYKISVCSSNTKLSTWGKKKLSRLHNILSAVRERQLTSSSPKLYSSRGWRTTILQLLKIQTNFKQLLLIYLNVAILFCKHSYYSSVFFLWDFHNSNGCILVLYLLKETTYLYYEKRTGEDEALLLALQ